MVNTNSKSSIMPSKKRNNNKKRPLVQVAPLYSEDIGTEGIKRSPTSATECHQRQSFHMQLDDEEEHRRQRREVRNIESDWRAFSVRSYFVPTLTCLV
jgi:hypothetical protein